MAYSGKDSKSLRLQVPVYSAASFSNSVADIIPLVIPLWLIGLGVEPFLMGLVIGARYIGPLIFSIHGGLLMDRLGTRRVMLFFSAIATVIPFFYPFAGWLPFAVALQLVGGLADSLGWSGAQTLTNQAFKGDARYSGRMIAATRAGTLAGPPIAGAVWELIGPEGGFLVMALWGAGTLISVYFVPATAVPAASPENRPVRVRNVLPRLSDYIEAFRLLAIPAIFMVMSVSALRQVGASVQASFYAVYLEEIGISAAMIGALIAMNGLAGIGAFITGTLTAMFDAFKLLIVTCALSILMITLVPLFDNLIILFVLSAIRGLTLAVSVALLLAVVAQYAGAHRQGVTIGLRSTSHQLVNVVIPVIFGGIAQYFGLSAAFYGIGAVTLILLGWIALNGAPEPAEG